MNSRIFVQPSIGIPAGPITHRTVVETTAKKPVAAIIRPTPRQSGQKSGSLRLDAAQESGPPKSHVRNYDLDDYVNWLKAKIEADKLDARKPNSPAPVPVEAETIVKRTTTDHTAASDNLFSTMTDTDLVKVLDDRPLPPLSKGVRFEEFSELGYSTENIRRTHESHIDSVGLEIPNAHFPHTAAIEPTPVVTKAIEPTPTEEVVAISAKDTDTFISAVSQAIASVLTDKPEPEFEQKVRTHFESELHARAVNSLVNARQVEEDPIETEPVSPVATTAFVADQIPEAAIASEVESVETASLAQPVVMPSAQAGEIASDIIASSSKEIPTSIAAWDVEDFRWPIVTNQMIVSGGSAIDQLAESTFGMLSPNYQRLAITGLGRGDGASSIAITLARWVAALGKNVLLVDANLTSPSLSTQIGLAPNLSWVNAINQSLPAAEVIVRSQKSNLCVMPLAQVVSRATWPRFVYDNLGELVDQVRSHFDLVVIDAGPSNQLLAELSRPQLLVDATMMVHNGVDSSEFRRAKSLLEGFGLSKFIIARNRAHQKTVNVA